MLDLETDIGLVAGSALLADAEHNASQLHLALQAMWPGGQFHYASGGIGDTMEGIKAKAKEFFFAGSPRTLFRTGGKLRGAGSGNWPLPSASYDPTNGVQGGANTIFTWTDGGSLILNNEQFEVGGIEFRSRPWILNNNGMQGPTTGIKAPVAIKICGYDTTPVSGLHYIHDCTFTGYNSAIVAKAGYYDDAGSFVPDESNADNFVVDRCNFFGCAEGLKSENEQSVCIKLRDCRCGAFAGAGFVPFTIANLDGGGKIRIDSFSLNHPQATVFKVNRFSPNTNRLTANDIVWDQVSAEGNYLTAFEYTGELSDLVSKKWAVRVDGHANNSEASPLPDYTHLLRVPAGFPTGNIKIDMTGLPSVHP